jgi:hypothetical protein
MTMSKPLQILGISDLDLRSNTEKPIGEPGTCVADWLPSLSCKLPGATDPVTGPSPRRIVRGETWTPVSQPGGRRASALSGRALRIGSHLMQCHDSPQRAYPLQRTDDAWMDLPGDVLGCVVRHWGVSRVLPGVSMSGGGIAPDLAFGCHGSTIRPSRGGVVMSGRCVTRGCRLGTYLPTLMNQGRAGPGKRTKSRFPMDSEDGNKGGTRILKPDFGQDIFATFGAWDREMCDRRPFRVCSARRDACFSQCRKIQTTKHTRHRLIRAQQYRVCAVLGYDG